MLPLVTLAMPVYNGENYISDALHSILAQDYANFELIITDNASGDATRDICLAFAERDQRIRYIANPKNLGAAPNYNVGFELAQGTFLKWCAHDDVISPGYVSACVAALQADPGASLAFGRTELIDSRGNLVEHDGIGEMDAIVADDPAQRFLEAITRADACFPIFGVFRMDALRRTTLHRSYYGSDRALIAEAALLGRCLRVESAVFYNREHPQRSIHLAGGCQRNSWQDTSSRQWISERMRLQMHLIEIAARHPGVVPPWRALAQLAKLKLGSRASRLTRSVRAFLSGAQQQGTGAAPKAQG